MELNQLGLLKQASSISRCNEGQLRSRPESNARIGILECGGFPARREIVLLSGLELAALVNSDQ